MRTSKLVGRIEMPWDSLTYVFPSIKTLWLAKNGLETLLVHILLWMVIARPRNLRENIVFWIEHYYAEFIALTVFYTLLDMSDRHTSNNQRVYGGKQPFLPRALHNQMGWAKFPYTNQISHLNVLKNPMKPKFIRNLYIKSG